MMCLMSVNGVRDSGAMANYELRMSTVYVGSSYEKEADSNDND